jgi:hypothetical protein
MIAKAWNEVCNIDKVSGFDSAMLVKNILQIV